MSIRRKMQMELKFQIVQAEDLAQYKADMQEAFQLGAEEGGYPANGTQILPEKDIDRSLLTKGAIAYKAVLDNQIVGGAIIVLDENTHSGHLDFLYVKHGVQSKGIGKFMWFEIEKLHPDIKIWETCTPYFEKRNIHFYVNVCKFHIVEFFNAYHKDVNEPEDFFDEEDSGMFEFRKDL